MLAFRFKVQFTDKIISKTDRFSEGMTFNVGTEYIFKMTLKK